MDGKLTEKVISQDTTRHLQDCNRLNQVLGLHLSGLFKSGERIQKGRRDSSQAGIPDTLTRCLAVYSTFSRVGQPATCLKISPCEVQHLEDGGALWNLHTRQYLSVLMWAVSLPGVFPLFYQQSSFHFLSTSVWICSDGLQSVLRAVNCSQLIVGAHSEITGRLMGRGKGETGSRFSKFSVCVCVMGAIWKRWVAPPIDTQLSAPQEAGECAVVSAALYQPTAIRKHTRAGTHTLTHRARDQTSAGIKGLFQGWKNCGLAGGRDFRRPGGFMWKVRRQRTISPHFLQKQTEGVSLWPKSATYLGENTLMMEGTTWPSGLFQIKQFSQSARGLSCNNEQDRGGVKGRSP